MPVKTNHSVGSGLNFRGNHCFGVIPREGVDAEVPQVARRGIGIIFACFGWSLEKDLDCDFEELHGCCHLTTGSGRAFSFWIFSQPEPNSPMGSGGRTSTRLSPSLASPRSTLD